MYITCKNEKKYMFCESCKICNCLCNTIKPFYIYKYKGH